MINQFRKILSDNYGVLIRIDDVAENMNWEMFDKIEILFNKHNIKPVLGVIPNNQDNSMAGLIIKLYSRFSITSNTSVISFFS